MRVKILLYSLTVFSVLFPFIACNDDLRSVGNVIQPEGDGVFVKADTITMTARTVSLKDSVYARTIYGMLGEYTDPIFGKIKSDYLAEFTGLNGTKFLDNIVSIDSVYFSISISSFIGDSINPMGLSIYEVNKPLARNFFTNVDPSKYCDMTKVLARSTFTVKNLPKYSSTRIIISHADTTLGHRFVNQWKTNPNTFSNSDLLKEFFPGVYVTSTFGTGTLINVGYTYFDINYKYVGKNTAGDKDSIRAATFTLPVSSEVIQMNHVENQVPESILAESKVRSYMLTPAGVATEITIPFRELVNKVGTDKVLNSAMFNIKGFSEEEADSKMSKPTYVLFVNKDSVYNYFSSNDTRPNNKTNMLLSRSSSNTYYYTGTSGNISTLINYYIEQSKETGVVPEYLRYMLIPVGINQTVNSSNQSTIIGVYNLMQPTSAILRADKDNLMLPIIYSKYNKSGTN